MGLGSLVVTAVDVPGYPIDDFTYPLGSEVDYTIRIPKGTAGIVVKRPSAGRPRQYLVQLVGTKEVAWLFNHEIMPYDFEK